MCGKQLPSTLILQLGKQFLESGLALIPWKLGAQPGASSPGGPVLLTTQSPLCLMLSLKAAQALPLRVPFIPNPSYDWFIVLIAGPLRSFSSAHPLVLDYLKILLIPEVPSLSPLALGPSMFGFLILCFLILFLGLNYDYTASLRRVDLK